MTVASQCRRFSRADRKKMVVEACPKTIVETHGRDDVVA